MAKVLVVDDIPENVKLLARALERRGYVVLQAYDGVKALESAASNEPDLVLLDVMMPGLDGIEVCRHLKANPALTSIPVIMVSALDGDTDLKSAFDAGAQDYIIKPFNLLVAVARIEIALMGGRSAASRKVKADALREREQRFQAVFDQTFQCMWLLDLEGCVVEANQAALSGTGQSREDVVGQYFWKNPWWENSPQVEVQLKAAVAAASQGQIVNVELERQVSGHRQVCTNFALTRMTDGSKAAVLLLVISKDISDGSLSATGILAATAAGDVANHVNDESVADDAHEIGSPMDANTGITPVILDPDLNRVQGDRLEIVRTATDSLLSVIDDMLDFSKLEAGKLELDRSEFGLRESIQDTTALLGEQAQEKGIELVLCVDPSVPDQLTGDGARLRQIVVHLVDNAIKFTERGKVQVEVDLDDETPADGNARLHFRVTDTGIGIPAERQEAVFAPFAQTNGFHARRYGGAGLGLAISSELVRLMGGQLWVESSVGRGSTFHFTVDLTRAEEPQLAEQVSPGNRLEGMSVLAVDTNADNRQVFEKMLIQWRMKPTMVDGAEAALASLDRARDAGPSFSLMFIDVMMPGTDGATVAEQLMSDTRFPLNLLVILTSRDKRGLTRRMQRGAIAVCLWKPVRRLELNAAILAALNRTPRDDQEPSRAAPLPISAAECLRILMAEDDPFNQRVASLILAKAGHKVTIAGNGREVVASLERQSFDLVLLDLQMPEMDGFQTTTAIRSMERGTGRHIPIIAVTAGTMKVDRDRCMEVGMDGYVSKPIQQVNLRQAIENFICESMTRETAEIETPSGAPESPIDTDAALARVNGDRRFLSEMAARFLEESPRLMVQIRNAVAAGDSARLVTPIHTLKNWTGNFAASAAFDAVSELEAPDRTGSVATCGKALARLEQEIERLRGAMTQFDGEPVRLDREVDLSAVRVDSRSLPCIP